MTIYIPYFYIIQELSTGIYYAGSKYGKDANPKNFMIEGGYFSSSVKINEIINREGLNAFSIRRLKIFNTKEEAYNYETRFLQKVNARNNPKFYNGHNNNFGFDSLHMKDIMFGKYGVENASQLDEVKEKKKKTTLKNYGVENPYQLKRIREKVKTNNKEKYGVEYLLCSKEFQEKTKQTLLDRYGVENPFSLKHVREKRDNAMIEKYGTTCSLGIHEIREKSKAAMEEKYGYQYASQIPEIKEQKIISQKKKLSRISVQAIRNYCIKFNLKLGSGWYLKSDEYMEQKLKELVEAHGLIED